MNLRPIQFGTWGVTAVFAAAVFGGVAWRLEARREAAAGAIALRAAEIAGQQAERTRLDADRARLLAAQAGRNAAPAKSAAATSEITEATVRKEAMLSLVELKKESRLMVLPGSGTRRTADDPWSLERDGRPTAAFGALFGLTAAQLAELQAVAERVRARVAELALSNATVRRSAPGGVIIEIAEAPEIAVLREQWRSAFVQAVGDDGLAAYEGLRTGGFGGLLNSFGLGKRTLTIERRGVAYQVGEGTTGNGPGSGRTIGSTSLDRRGVELRLGALARLLPENF